MLKVVVIDDEKNAVDSLTTIINQYCVNAEIVGSTTSATKGINLIMQIKPQLVFIDIEMPGLTGFDVIEKLDDLQTLFVFTTAHPNYAIKAFKINAFDYILKPIEIDEIQKVIDKALKFLNKNETLNPITKISLSTGNGIVFLDPNEILHIEADGRYSTVFFSNRKSINVARSLSEIEIVVDDKMFFRCHNSIIVNINQVSSLDYNSGGYLILKNGEKVPLSRRRKNDFLKIFEKK